MSELEELYRLRNEAWRARDRADELLEQREAALNGAVRGPSDDELRRAVALAEVSEELVSTAEKKRTRREQLEREVVATICDHLRSALTEGKDLWREVEEAFPAVPQHIRINAVLEIEEEQDDVWFENLERTIEADVLRRAIGGR